MTKRDDVARGVRTIIVENLNIDSSKVVDSAHIMDDLGADSLDAVEIAMAVEEEFMIFVDDLEAMKNATVAQIVDAVMKALDEKESG